MCGRSDGPIVVFSGTAGFQPARACSRTDSRKSRDGRSKQQPAGSRRSQDGSVGAMKVGEIVAVETASCTAQSYELNRAPAFGSLLRVAAPGQPAYYALCYG